MATTRVTRQYADVLLVEGTRVTRQYADVLMRVTEESVADTLGITDSVDFEIIWHRTVTDTLGITDSVSAVGDWRRSVSDTLGITDIATVTSDRTASAANTLGLTDGADGGGIETGNASNTLGITDSVTCDTGCPTHTSTTTFRLVGDNRTTTVLPSPVWGDSVATASTVQIIRTMGGGTRTYNKARGSRHKWQWTFLLSRHKSLELRAFIEAFNGQAITVYDHLGRSRTGYILNNPSVYGSGARAGGWPGDESQQVTIEFEEQV